MIGNDVVDLADAEVQPGAAHRRFDARVFAPAERALLSASPAPHRLRWQLWAAKEAAYKVARKLDPRTVFAPSRFVVDLHDGLVRHGASVFWLRLEATDTYVHAVVGRGFPPETAAHRLGALTLEPGADGAAPSKACPSHAARALAIEALATALNEDPRDLAIVTRDRIPHCKVRGRPGPVDLSLSHHGGFVACAFALENGA